MPRIVVTPNFDDFLYKALTLFGIKHSLCDHPLTTERIRIDNNERPQIIHVHGTYQFYDCCNLAGEITDNATTTHASTLTMGYLLDGILRDHSPLVIGYSGWEDDVIMTALKRRMQTALGYNLYWFCYKRSSIDALPAWIKKNNNVVFVAQPEPAATSSGVEAKPQASAMLSEEKENLLRAEDVFSGLIRHFELPVPKLFTNPLVFFAEQLKDSLPKDDKKDDIYSIASVIKTVETARPVAETEMESSLKKVRNAARSARYDEAIEAADKINKTELNDDERRELSFLIYLSALNKGSTPEISLIGYNIVIGLIESLLNGKAANNDLKELMAMALFNKGVCLGQLGKNEEAIKTYDEVISRFGDSPEPALKAQVAMALNNKGVCLGQLGRNEEEIKTYDEVISRFGDSPEPALKAQVAMARSMKDDGK